MNVFRARVELLLAVCSMLSPLSKCVNVSGDNETRNRFIPAPPGQRPACAKPGLTYCEYVSNYPTDTIISVLTELSGESFNVSSVFFDESDGFQEPSELLSGHFRKSRSARPIIPIGDLQKTRKSSSKKCTLAPKVALTHRHKWRFISTHILTKQGVVEQKIPLIP
ncbi:uncharacterized protein LOC143256213 isoform X2 [Tachypleus tridentatus]